MTFIEHAVAHLVVLLLQGPPYPVEVHSLDLGIAVLHERLESVHEYPRIAHRGQWPGDIT
jgi:hypothetical protein